MAPRMRVGLANRSLTRLSETQVLAAAPPVLWSNASVVLRPTLNVCHSRIACGLVWRTVTVACPPATICVGRSAFSQPGLCPAAPGSVARPPGARPSGTAVPRPVLARAAAATRALACAAWARDRASAVACRLAIDRCVVPSDCVESRPEAAAAAPPREASQLALNSGGGAAAAGRTSAGATSALLASSAESVARNSRAYGSRGAMRSACCVTTSLCASRRAGPSRSGALSHPPAGDPPRHDDSRAALDPPRSTRRARPAALDPSPAAWDGRAMLRLTELRLPLDHADDALERAVRDRLGLAPDAALAWSVFRRGHDARRRSAIVLVYTVDAALADEAALLARHAGDPRIRPAPDTAYRPVARAPAGLPRRPVVVGAGPCGLFAALLLARMGFRPIVLERGRAVRQRTRDTWGLWRRGVLDPESNVQFGEGGAGTFSDGKL